MEQSILKSIKKVLGISDSYTVFDLDILTFINSALSALNQIGVGVEDGLVVTDDTTEWSALGAPSNQTEMAKSYVYLKVRLGFDPPKTSFVINAIEKQISELEYRLNTMREEFRVVPEEVTTDGD